MYDVKPRQNLSVIFSSQLRPIITTECINFETLVRPAYSLEIFDPTVSAVKEKITFAPRPQNLNGLRVGLVENSKHNSDVLLLKIADRLKARYEIEMALLHRKESASDYVTEAAIEDLKRKADFVVAGIGD